MANIRREFGDDLTLKNGNLGINTTTAQEKVDVVGVVKGQDLYASGVSSLTAYEGFLRADNQIVESTTLEFGQGLKSSLSGEIIVGTGVTVTIGAVGLGTAEVGVGTTTDANGKTASNIDTTDINLAGGSQIECLKVYNTFTPPSGGTNERPYAPKPGELYYNYDFKTIEFFDGYGWRQVDNTTRSGRGVVGGGDSPGKTNSMEYITISTLGNAVDFGDQISARNVRGSCSSSTRGLWGGGMSPNVGDDIDYITIASAGDAIDFGNLTQARGTYAGGMSSSTRGLWAAGATPTKVNTIDFVEIATLGNAVDFGDTASLTNTAATASPIRGYICGGNGPSVATRDIRQITIASKGDSVDIAELSAISNSSSAASNSVRTVLFGGQSPAQDIRSMETFNLVTAGNAVVFGDLSGIRMLSASVASSTRGVCMSGRNPSNVNNIEYVTFSSLGDAIDFGDMSLARHKFQGCSDSHGGLGGF